MGHSRQRALRGVLLSEAEQEDAQLVRASQRGDQEAFALLVRRHQRRIFNLSLGLLTDEKDASESTQEAFVAAWQGLPSFRGEARFATWLYRLAYQCGLRQLERRKREHALKAALQAEQDLVGIRTEQRVTDTTRRHDLQALVREQLEHLPLEDRTVLILRHLHDQTYEEIAAILSIPVGTVKTQLFRARTPLKERLTGTAPLVTRATMAGTPLTENEEVMHPSGQFHLQGREQDNTPDHQEPLLLSGHEQDVSHVHRDASNTRCSRRPALCCSSTAIPIHSPDILRRAQANPPSRTVSRENHRPRPPWPSVACLCGPRG